MTSPMFEISGGFIVPYSVSYTSWPYPYVNPKVIDPANNNANLLFMSIPDTEDLADANGVAADNNLMWTHEFADADTSFSDFSTGNPYQITGPDSGFEFSISTTVDDSEPIRPAIGFKNGFVFTPANLGSDRYDALVEIAKREPAHRMEGTWFGPEPYMLTDLGIHFFSENLSGGSPIDITDKISYGIDTGTIDDGYLYILYGVVMVDSDELMEGVMLDISYEKECVWSDGVLDGEITGKWWIGLSPYDDGSGTVADPFVITTADELNFVRYNLDRHFVLGDDIDLSAYSNWEPLGTFTPLSDAPEHEETPHPKYAFTGTFNGDGYTISNLTIDQPFDMAVGLFGCVAGSETKEIEITGVNCNNCLRNVKRGLSAVDGVQNVYIDRVPGSVSTATVVLRESSVSVFALEDAVNGAGHYTAGAITDVPTPNAIYDLTVEDVDVTGMMLVGGVVGYAFNCNFDDVDLVSASGSNTIRGNSMLGGIVGGTVGGDIGSNIDNCDAEADIIVFDAMNSGMAGILGGGLEGYSVDTCTAVGTITAEGENVVGLGGLAGCIFEALYIQDSSATVIITALESGGDLIGGLTGFAGTYAPDSPTEISGCYADADISVAADAVRIGGLIGGEFFIEEYAAYFPDPSTFEIVDCETTGSITGGLEFVGGIAGKIFGDSTVDSITSSDMTWNGGAAALIGEEQP